MFTVTIQIKTDVDMVTQTQKVTSLTIPFSFEKTKSNTLGV